MLSQVDAAVSAVENYRHSNSELPVGISLSGAVS